MKKVLILSSKSPYPLRDGAAIRTHQSIRLIAELGYSVDVLYLSENDDLTEVKKGLEPYCQNVYSFVMTKRESYINVLIGLMTNLLPLQVNYFYSRKVRKWINRNASRYDIVYCNNIRTARYARGLSNEVILDYVDAYSMNYQAARDNIKGLWHWIYAIDYVRCNKFEQQLLQEFNKFLIISDIDRTFILTRAKNPAKISVIENYTTIDETKRIEQNNTSLKLVFVGAMNYEPNVTAVCYFCKWVLPSLIERYPGIVFYIVGKTPTNQVLELANEHVVVTGFVDSVWDYLKDATLVVTPMQSGSGLQNKILQALAVGACVVTTPKGFEGLVTDDGQPYVVNNSAEMIKVISRLIDHPEERRSSGEKAISYVKKHYDKEVIKSKLKSLIEDD